MKTEICSAGRRGQQAMSFLAAITLLAILNSGAGWAASGEWNQLGPEGARIESILLDTQNPDVVYAGINGQGFARTGAGKSRLTVSNDGLLSSIVLSLAADPQDTSTLYAGTGGGGVYKSTDAGKFWSQANKGIELKTIQSLVADPSQPGTLYAGTWGDGIFKTTNGGQQWQPAADNLSGAFVYALAAAPGKAGHIYAGTSTGGWLTTDGGKTWTKFGQGVPEGIVEAVAINPKITSELLIAVNNWVPGKQYIGAIVRSEDGGKSWKTVGSGIPETRILSLAMDSANPKILYAGTEKGVFTSNDEGSAWASFGGQLKNPEVGALAVSSKSPERLFAGTHGGGVFETTVPR